jgi:glycosyltransferase involved in cell wall biosynthesis
VSARPSVSVVIRAYNAAPTIGRAVDSVLAQTVPPLEVIVVDDGSTDDLDAALEPTHEQITLVRTAHRGAAAALNAGAAAATGEFLAPLDADDTFDPRRLEVVGELAAQQPGLDLLCTDMRFISNGEVVGTFHEHNPFEFEDQRAAILERCFVGGCPVVRLERLREVGGFDEQLVVAEDWDCWLRLIFSGSRAGLVDAPYYDYTLVGGSLTADRIVGLRARVQMLEKAARELELTAAERRVLRRSLAVHRSRLAAVELGTAAARRQAIGYAVARGVNARVRVGAVAAAVSPSLGIRLLPRDVRPQERFR